jgi:DNA invertase Pin-like site-specific DNA recombinase
MSEKIAIGYTRLSQESDTSIDNQKRHIRKYADEHEYNLDQIYDEGEKSSGFSPDNLDEYQKVRQRINQDEDLDAVLLNDKRRLVRDIDEVMRVIPDLRQRNVELHTYHDEQLDLSDPMRAAIEILQAAAAHEEKMTEIKKAIESVEDRLSEGLDHGPPRYGMEYRPDGKYQRPGDKFETVERIWELRDDGWTYSGIEEETGVPSSTAQRIVDDREWYIKRKAMHQN